MNFGEQVMSLKEENGISLVAGTGQFALKLSFYAASC